MGQHEVVTAHLRGRLQLAVDPPVTLLYPPRVPGKVKVEEVRAVGLEVEALAGRVGRQQNSQRILGRVGIEAALDLLPPPRPRQPVDHFDPLIRPIRALDRLLEDGPQIALSALAVLREDQHPPLVPRRGSALGPRTKLGETRAQILSKPVHQAPHLGIRQVPTLLGDLLHAVEELLFAAPEPLRRRISLAARLGRDRHRLHLRLLLSRQLVFIPLAALVVRIWHSRQEGLLLAHACNRRRLLLLLPLPLTYDCVAMDLQGAGEGLDRGQQPLL